MLWRLKSNLLVVLSKYKIFLKQACFLQVKLEKCSVTSLTVRFIKVTYFSIFNETKCTFSFRFNEDCGFSCCNYREHQTHFHCMRKDCNYRFCDKTRFVQHTARHERLDTLCGDEFEGFRGVPCGRPNCELNAMHARSKILFINMLYHQCCFLYVYCSILIVLLFYTTRQNLITALNDPYSIPSLFDRGSILGSCC